MTPDSAYSGDQMMVAGQMPAVPAVVREVLALDQTWAGVAQQWAGQLTGTQLNLPDSGDSVEVRLVVPLPGPPEVRRILGEMCDLIIRLRWESVPRDRQSADLRGWVTLENGASLSFSGRMQISGQRPSAVQLEGVLRQSRMPTRLSEEVSRGARNAIQAFLEVLGEHVQARSETPNVAFVSRLMRDFWGSGDKLDWMYRNKEILKAAVEGLERSVRICTPRGVPAGDVDGHRRVVDDCLASLLEVERACRFAEKTRYGGEISRSLAELSRRQADEICDTTGRPRTPPLVSDRVVPVAGLASAHPEVPCLFALRLAPGESFRSAWRARPTDWSWWDKGYVMITDRRLIVVHDDGFAKVGKIDRIRPLASISDASVTGIGGEMGGPIVSMRTDHGVLTIEFSTACARDEADQVVSQLSPDWRPPSRWRISGFRRAR